MSDPSVKDEKAEDPTSGGGHVVMGGFAEGGILANVSGGGKRRKSKATKRKKSKSKRKRSKSRK